MVDNEQSREELMGQFIKDPEAHLMPKLVKRKQKQEAVEQKRQNKQELNTSLQEQLKEEEARKLAAAARVKFSNMPVGFSLSGKPGEQGNPEDVVTGVRRRLTPKR